jgi:hypothetical protein
MSAGVCARAMALTGHGELVARWRFPASPLIAIELDGRAWAEVDYFEASASVHWALEVKGPEHESVIGLPGLAGQVPEDIDEHEELRIAALDHSLDAAADRLGVRGQPLQARDA